VKVIEKGTFRRPAGIHGRKKGRCDVSQKPRDNKQVAVAVTERGGQLKDTTSFSPYWLQFEMEETALSSVAEPAGR
jgi:hypothetical protein